MATHPFPPLSGTFCLLFLQQRLFNSEFTHSISIVCQPRIVSVFHSLCNINHTINFLQHLILYFRVVTSHTHPIFPLFHILLLAICLLFCNIGFIQSRYIIIFHSCRLCANQGFCVGFLFYF